MQPIDLAAVVAARICHDLVSPVGAVVNGVELIREVDGQGIADELAMVDQSATRAARLLTFYRLAFGRVSADGAPGLSRTQLRDRLQPVLQAARVRVDWQALDGPALGPAAARLAGLLGLCGRACLGMSGVVELALDPDRDLPLTVRAIGDTASLGPAQQLWLQGATTPLPEPRQVEFVLAHAAAAELGLVLVLGATPGRVTLTVGG